ncbi:hypothetical protein [Streptomyces sp. NPDC046197]|uniref:hypothetical protein n=1 Tax=Streptomyces sp. NPDC046197 TaxID=3154337 RepID=UPI0033CFC12D
MNPDTPTVREAAKPPRAPSAVPAAATLSSGGIPISSRAATAKETLAWSRNSGPTRWMKRYSST